MKNDPPGAPLGDPRLAALAAALLGENAPPVMRQMFRQSVLALQRPHPFAVAVAPHSLTFGLACRV